MKKILVCTPEHFEVNYEINPWMKNQIGVVDKDLAQQQWITLIKELAKVSTLFFIGGVENLPDMVFTANAGIALGSTFLISKFANKERELEEKYFTDWAQENFTTVINSKLNFEGEGDCLNDD